MDWAGLLTEQVLVDTIMHTKRIHEPKTIREVEAPNQFDGYVAGLKGYVEHGVRWGTATGSSRTTWPPDHGGRLLPHLHEPRPRLRQDRLRRYRLLVLHAPRNRLRRDCQRQLRVQSRPERDRGRARRQGSHLRQWHVHRRRGMDRLPDDAGRRIGVRIAGDFARAKLWPALDRHLSGNIGARILNAVIK